MAKKLTKKQHFYQAISNIVKTNATRPTYKDIIENIDKEVKSFLKTQTILKKIPKEKEISDIIYGTFLDFKLKDEKFIKSATSIEDLIFKLEDFFYGLMTYGSCAYMSSISDILEYKDFVIHKGFIPKIKKTYYNSFPKQKIKNDLLEQIIMLTKVLKVNYDKDIERIIEDKKEQLKKLTNDFELEEMVRLEIVEKLMDKIIKQEAENSVNGRV